MNQRNANKNVSNVGTSWLTQVLDTQLTTSPLFIHNVMDKVDQAKPSRELSSREKAHLQTLSDAMYHAWHRIWQTGQASQQFKCQHSGVNLAFVMLCTELGTAIALRQKDFFGKLHAL